MATTKVLAHPELIALFNAWRIADIDYTDMAGSSDSGEFRQRAIDAQAAFKSRRAELEEAGVDIWKGDSNASNN